MNKILMRDSFALTFTRDELKLIDWLLSSADDDGYVSNREAECFTDVMKKVVRPWLESMLELAFVGRSVAGIYRDDEEYNRIRARLHLVERTQKSLAYWIDHNVETYVKLIDGGWLTDSEYWNAIY